MNPEFLKQLASRGAGYIIGSAACSAEDFKEIATRASSGGGTITITQPLRLDVEDLKDIATRGHGHVVFDFTR